MVDAAPDGSGTIDFDACVTLLRKQLLSEGKINGLPSVTTGASRPSQPPSPPPPSQPPSPPPPSTSGPPSPPPLLRGGTERIDLRGGTERIDRRLIKCNARGVQEAHSDKPQLWNFQGTEVDLAPGHQYIEGGQLWYLRSRAFEKILSGRPIAGVPMNAAARASGVKTLERERADDNLYNLEGLEGLDKVPPCTAVIGPSGRIYSSRTFGFLEVGHAPRRWAIKIVDWAPFDAFILVTILASISKVKIKRYTHSHTSIK